MNWFLKFFRRAEGAMAAPPGARQILTKEQRNHLDMERLMVLAGRPADDPLWKVVLSYADEHARNELLVGLAPGLNDSDRQYNAGRAASAEDFAIALRDLHRKAQQEAARLKK